MLALQRLFWIVTPLPWTSCILRYPCGLQLLTIWLTIKEITLLNNEIKIKIKTVTRYCVTCSNELDVNTTALTGQEQGVAADLWAPAGCTASSQPEPAAAGRSVWSPSPPDPAPTGWTRSVQTAPAAERRERKKKKDHWHYNKYSQTMRMWSSCLIPSQNKDVCLCNEMKILPLVWSQAHQKAWVTLCGTCSITG